MPHNPVTRLRHDHTILEPVIDAVKDSERLRGVVDYANKRIRRDRNPPAEIFGAAIDPVDRKPVSTNAARASAFCE